MGDERQLLVVIRAVTLQIQPTMSCFVVLPKTSFSAFLILCLFIVYNQDWIHFPHNKLNKNRRFQTANYHLLVLMMQNIGADLIIFTPSQNSCKLQLRTTLRHDECKQQSSPQPAPGNMLC